MTQIFTVLTFNKVVQVSDRRLTWPDGSLADDHANKAVCVSCADGWFAISYTGAAQVGRSRTPTDEWLVELLSSADAGSLVSADVIELIRSSADASSLNGRTSVIPTCFVAAGFVHVSEARVTPLLWEVRNYDETGGRLALRGFVTQYCRLKAGADPRTALVITVAGSDSSVTKPIRHRLKKLVKQRFFQTEPVDAVSRKLVSLTRLAASTEAAADRVGRNCMAVSLEPTSQIFSAQYHPDGTDQMSYGPHFVQPGMAFKGLQIWGGDGPPPWLSPPN